MTSSCNRGSTRPLRTGSRQDDETLGRRHETARTSQAQASLGSRCGHGDRPTLPNLAEYMLGRDPGIIEEQLRRCRRGDRSGAAPSLAYPPEPADRSGRHDARHPGRLHDAEDPVGEGAAEHHCPPVQDIVVAVEDRLRLDTSKIGAGLRFTPPRAQMCSPLAIRGRK